METLKGSNPASCGTKYWNLFYTNTCSIKWTQDFSAILIMKFILSYMQCFMGMKVISPTKYQRHRILIGFDFG